jgi:hypothetical protein
MDNVKAMAKFFSPVMVVLAVERFVLGYDLAFIIMTGMQFFGIFISSIWVALAFLLSKRNYSPRVIFVVWYAASLWMAHYDLASTISHEPKTCFDRQGSYAC